MLVLLKLLGILAFIILLLRLGWNAGLVLILASAVTGLLFGLPPRDYLLEALGAAVAPLTLRLLAIVLLVLWVLTFVKF